MQPKQGSRGLLSTGDARRRLGEAGLDLYTGKSQGAAGEDQGPPGRPRLESGWSWVRLRRGSRAEGDVGLPRPMGDGLGLKPRGASGGSRCWRQELRGWEQPRSRELEDELDSASGRGEPRAAAGAGDGSCLVLLRKPSQPTNLQRDSSKELVLVKRASGRPRSCLREVTGRWERDPREQPWSPAKREREREGGKVVAWCSAWVPEVVNAGSPVPKRGTREAGRRPGGRDGASEKQGRGAWAAENGTGLAVTDEAAEGLDHRGRGICCRRSR